MTDTKPDSNASPKSGLSVVQASEATLCGRNNQMKQRKRERKRADKGPSDLEGGLHPRQPVATDTPAEMATDIEAYQKMIIDLLAKANDISTAENERK